MAEDATLSTGSAALQAGAQDPIVVCGLGRVGSRVVDLLRRLGLRTIVITDEARGDRHRAAERAGAEVVLGDARDGGLLHAVGAHSPRALIAATNHDVVNMEVALDARREHPRMPVVVRVFNRDLAHTLEHTLGSARAVASSALAAPAVAFAGVGCDVVAALERDAHQLLVGRARVGAGSALAGAAPAALAQRGVVVASRSSHAATLQPGELVTLIIPRTEFALLRGPHFVEPRAGTGGEFHPTRLGYLALTWTRAPALLRRVFLVLLALIAASVLVFEYGLDLPFADALYFVITTVTTVGYGDITPKGNAPLQLYSVFLMLLGSVAMAVLYSFATSFVVSEQLRAELQRPPLPAGGHVVVVGVGNVGYRTIEELRAAGYSVVAVDTEVDGELVGPLRQVVPTVSGDARAQATLVAANVATAAAVVAATGDDAVNLSVALTARRLNPRVRTVVRLFDADLATKVERAGLVDVALSASLASAPTFVASALFEAVLAAWLEPGALVVLRELATPASWQGQTPAELLAAGECEVVFADSKPAPPDEPLRAKQLVLLSRRSLSTGELVHLAAERPPA